MSLCSRNSPISHSIYGTRSLGNSLSLLRSINGAESAHSLTAWCFWWPPQLRLSKDLILGHYFSINSAVTGNSNQIYFLFIHIWAWQVTTLRKCPPVTSLLLPKLSLLLPSRFPRLWSHDVKHSFLSKAEKQSETPIVSALRLDIWSLLIWNRMCWSERPHSG